ncbi:MAG: sugar ABC transporter permease [Clostridia bacterium]|nr:sugar ABC transporter permease [Clostridia bacterium]
MKNQAAIKKTIKSLFVSTALKQDRSLYLMFLPVFLYYFVFCYIPMAGIILAFKEFSPRLGIFGSEWIGFRHFTEFFTGPKFFNVLWNTLRINIMNLIFGFPAPIILALMLNEMKSRTLKRCIQTVTYMPHFISLVVAVGLILDFTKRTGIVNNIIVMLGGERTAFMSESDFFTPIYVISGIWQEVGWGSIIYLAALSGINMDLYEAASIDGAGRWRKMISITLPGIMPTMVIMLILRMGQMMSLGSEKIILMYNDLIMDKADVISSYVYRLAFGTAPDYGFSTAVNLFNTVINVILLVSANHISNKMSEVSLW